jgi:hypothetical protein
VFLRTGNGEIRTALDERRSTASGALHRRPEHLRPSDKPRYARDLRRQGWSYRRIADVLKEPYRLIAHWLGSEGDRAMISRSPPPSVELTPAPASVSETLTELSKPAKPAKPAETAEPRAAQPAGRREPSLSSAPSPEPRGERDMQAVMQRLDRLSTKLDDLVAAIEADRESQRKERAERRARDAKLLELLEQLAAKLGQQG